MTRCCAAAHRAAEHDDAAQRHVAAALPRRRCLFGHLPLRVRRLPHAQLAGAPPCRTSRLQRSRRHAARLVPAQQPAAREGGARGGRSAGAGGGAARRGLPRCRSSVWAHALAPRHPCSPVGGPQACRRDRGAPGRSRAAAAHPTSAAPVGSRVAACKPPLAFRPTATPPVKRWEVSQRPAVAAQRIWGELTDSRALPAVRKLILKDASVAHMGAKGWRPAGAALYCWAACGGRRQRAQQAPPDPRLESSQARYMAPSARTLTCQPLSPHQTGPQARRLAISTRCRPLRQCPPLAAPQGAHTLRSHAMAGRQD